MGDNGYRGGEQIWCVLSCDQYIV